MATVTKKIGFTIQLDDEAIAPASPEVFIFQLLNRLGYEHTITSITIDDTTLPIDKPEDLSNLELKEGKELRNTP